MPEYKTPVSRHAFKYGAYIFVLIAFLLLLSFLLDQTTSALNTYVAYGVILLGLFYSAYAFREQKLQGYISYGKAFRVIFQTALFYGLLIMGYTFFHYSVVAPDLLQDFLVLQLEQMAEENPDMRQEEFDGLRFFFKNFVYTWWGLGITKLINGLLWGLFGGLIISMIVKKEHPETSPFN
ncbi:MAG: DUF4199 domain-containing protein [Bacteroidales bacterium]